VNFSNIVRGATSVALLVVVMLFAATARGSEPADAPTIADVDRAISLATDYLVASCQSDGKFVYSVDTATGKTSSDYNVVRHAGAMYALAMAYRVKPDPKIVEALKRAGEYLRLNNVRPGPTFKGHHTTAVWAAPLHKQGDAKATLGATGLGLVGLIGLESVAPDSVSRGELQSLGEFLRFLQKPDGQFHSKYLAQDGGKFSAWGSLYYPGEAALALVSLHQIAPSEKWLSAGMAALEYLAKTRAGKTEVPADNWALIATAKLLSLPTPQTGAIDRERLISHAVQICEDILPDQIENASPPGLNGGFKSDGRTTPTSTRLEGLQATLEFLPADRAALRSRIERAVREGVRFLIRAQIQTGPYAGGVPGAVATAEKPAATDIRVDYVQHFLSAMIRYRQTLANHGNAPISSAR